MHKHKKNLEFLCALDELILSIMKHPILSLAILFVLKTILSDDIKATPIFLKLLLVWCTFFLCFCFQPVFLYFNCVYLLNIANMKFAFPFLITLDFAPIEGTLPLSSQ